jgi:hypothetical protein
MPSPVIKILESPEEMTAVEELQRAVWPGSETDIVPAHMLITAIHNGGLVAGAFDQDKLIGFVFGFPGIEFTPDGPRPKHCSHMMGIHPVRNGKLSVTRDSITSPGHTIRYSAATPISTSPSWAQSAIPIAARNMAICAMD